MIAMTSNPFSIAAPHALAADSNVVSSDIIPRDDGGLSGLGGVIIDPRVLGGLASGAKSAPPMAEHVHLFASSNAYGRPWDSKVGIGGRVSAAGEGGVTRGDAVAVDSNISTSVNPAGTIGEGSRSSTPVQPLPIDLIQSDFPRTPSPVYTGLAAGSAARRNNDLNSKLFLRSLPVRTFISHKHDLPGICFLFVSLSNFKCASPLRFFLLLFSCA